MWAAPTAVDLSRKLRENARGLVQHRKYPDSDCSCGTPQWIVSFSGDPPGGTKALDRPLLRPTAKEVQAFTWGLCQHRSGCWAGLCSSTQVDQPKATHPVCHVLQLFQKYWQFSITLNLLYFSGFFSLLSIFPHWNPFSLLLVFEFRGQRMNTGLGFWVSWPLELHGPISLCALHL